MGLHCLEREQVVVNEGQYILYILLYKLKNKQTFAYCNSLIIFLWNDAGFTVFFFHLNNAILILLKSVSCRFALGRPLLCIGDHREKRTEAFLNFSVETA